MSDNKPQTADGHDLVVGETYFQLKFRGCGMGSNCRYVIEKTSKCTCTSIEKSTHGGFWCGFDVPQDSSPHHPNGWIFKDGISDEDVGDEIIKDLSCIEEVTVKTLRSK